MSSHNNTASRIPAITEAMLKEVGEQLHSSTKDRDHIITELVTHIKKQHRIICNLNAKVNSPDQDDQFQLDTLVEIIENHGTQDSTSSRKADKSVSHLHTAEVTTKAKKSANLQVAQPPHDSENAAHKTQLMFNGLSDDQRKQIEDEIKAELLTRIKNDLREEIQAEINAKLGSGKSENKPETTTRQQPIAPEKPAGKSHKKSTTTRKNQPPQTSDNSSVKVANKRIPTAKQTNPVQRKNSQEAVTTSANDIANYRNTIEEITLTVPEGTAELPQKKETSLKKPAEKAKPQHKKTVARQTVPVLGGTDSPAQATQQALQKSPQPQTIPQASVNDSNLWAQIHSPVVEDDEEDDENDEIDNEVLYSLNQKLSQEKARGIVDHNAPALLEVTRIHDGEIKDLAHIAIGSHYYAQVGDKTVKIASNGKNNQCQFYYSDRFFTGTIVESQAGTKKSSPLQTQKPGKLSRYSLPPNKIVVLKAGNDEYRLRSVPTTISPKVAEPQKEKQKGFKHFLQYSAAAHIAIIVVFSLLFALTSTKPEVKEEPRFAQVDLTQLNQPKPTPEPKPTPKPKPTPAPKPPTESKQVEQPKVEKPKPVKKDQKVKVTKKPASLAPKPKNAGGGSANGGNLKKRDVKSSGLLAALGTKSGKAPGKKQALATISSIDAVSTINTSGAKLKVGGLAAKVQGSRIEVASGELIDTKGSTSVLRSGGAEGSGSVAALETGITGNREVQGRVSATLNRTAKIQGGLSRDEVKRVIDAHMDEVVYCYEKTLLNNPGLAGKAVFEWKVQLSGRVGEVNIKSSSLRSNEIHSCIKRAIKTWQFPQPTGTAVAVSFPFIFDSVEF